MPNITRIMQWVSHAACTGQKKRTYKIVVWKPERNKPPEDLDIDARMLKLILNLLAPNIIYVYNMHSVMLRMLMLYDYSYSAPI
jgi:hypothetical protein